MSAGCPHCPHCQRAGRQRTREAIAPLYLAGLKLTAIAEAIGRTPGSTSGEIGHMRRDGWDLPYRLPPRVRCSDCGERLVDAEAGCGFCAMEARAS